MRNLRIATRGSHLALTQTGQVAEMVRHVYPQIATELVAISTRGDRLSGSLADVGGKGLFTMELEDALRAGSVDMAVHSAKDLPAAMDSDFTIAAVPLSTEIGSLTARNNTTPGRTHIRQVRTISSSSL